MSQSSKALVPDIIYLCSFIASVMLQLHVGAQMEQSQVEGILFSRRPPLPILWCCSTLPTDERIANAFMMVTSVGMESELVDKQVEGSAFVDGSLHVYCVV
ncbi:uncharacterized protein [Nicotiana tomentosiformis]|uniref:Uncharacterized protein n=1 Tax=Nicotiana tabacum TaxID=4097 RepID=A0A1S3YXS8_TOBAC|nr:uncharacterized protein LOC104112600 [Nicotiana tomentosiformis]XP_016456999.1 PREDICTED: uncharacterized protein LOC107780897 [Nicotiana tabacum]